METYDGSARVKMGGAIHINGFALDQKYHGLIQEVSENGTHINLSDFLLYDCLERAKEIHDNMLGCSFVTLCATKEGKGLYARNGFEPLDDDMGIAIGYKEKECIPMYLCIDME